MWWWNFGVVSSCQATSGWWLFRVHVRLTTVCFLTAGWWLWVPMSSGTFQRAWSKGVVRCWRWYCWGSLWNLIALPSQLYNLPSKNLWTKRFCIKKREFIANLWQFRWFFNKENDNLKSISHGIWWDLLLFTITTKSRKHGIRVPLVLDKPSRFNNPTARAKAAGSFYNGMSNDQTVDVHVPPSEPRACNANGIVSDM